MRREFGDDAPVSLHLAPPLFSPRDKSTGLPRKRAFGPWIFKAMAMLAPMGRLRGTPFDTFGYARERRTKRQLLADYAALTNRLAATLTPDMLTVAMQLAELPGEVRGFGHVKAASITKAQARRDALLRELEQPALTQARPVELAPS